MTTPRVQTVPGVGRRVPCPGAWAFTLVKHYWELDVTQVPAWVLRVCKSILTSDTSISIGAEEAFFYILTKVLFCPPPPHPLVQFVKRPPGRIGVFLDYDNGAVTASMFLKFPSFHLLLPLIPFLCLNLHELSISQTIY